MVPATAVVVVVVAVAVALAVHSAHQQYLPHKTRVHVAFWLQCMAITMAILHDNLDSLVLSLSRWHSGVTLAH